MLTEKQIAERDAQRNLGEELLESVLAMKSGHAARVTKVTPTLAARARAQAGVSQAVFADQLGVSKRTLQEWEQGRRSPTGAAQTLLRIAIDHPDALKNLETA
ncbi:transcriptional regulator [Chromobacterium sp. ATCC 53434]|uniref:helix-turn-helix domain-containing protein n=1 Tax=Chromobacterium TaxID=535 RepID=UPI000C77F458|nr:helix-turn-helix domain-containing protein [Chromobacterium sp. ATCC 53434]AUH50474.1 transcriptional regulator [Chromobacterium sp. ATCC 53434]